jgi:hypothetical protein
MTVYKGYTRSKLPGGLAAEAESAAGMNEDFLFEFVAHQGCGVCLTAQSLHVVQGGVLKTGALISKRSASFDLPQIQSVELRFEADSSDEKNFYLHIVAPSALAPSWASKLKLRHDAVPEAHRLALALQSMVSALRESMGSLPPAGITCPHCQQAFQPGASRA